MRTNGYWPTLHLRRYYSSSRRPLCLAGRNTVGGFRSLELAVQTNTNPALAPMMDRVYVSLRSRLPTVILAARLSSGLAGWH